MSIELLIGKTLKEINKTDDSIEFITTEDEKFLMFHSQDCCENVQVDDIDSDINDLIGSPILQAEERTNSEDRFGREDLYESWTWTFYTIRNIKTSVTIKWLGSSNGYYSESVSFEKQ